ncbi:MAG: hypothetical protein ACJAYU_000401 [Bradymonadia bacterium]|jgi:hypothetical protein
MRSRAQTIAVALLSLLAACNAEPATEDGANAAVAEDVGPDVPADAGDPTDATSDPDVATEPDTSNVADTIPDLRIDITDPCGERACEVGTRQCVEDTLERCLSGDDGCPALVAADCAVLVVDGFCD